MDDSLLMKLYEAPWQNKSLVHEFEKWLKKAWDKKGEKLNKSYQTLCFSGFDSGMWKYLLWVGGGGEEGGGLKNLESI